MDVFTLFVTVNGILISRGAGERWGGGWGGGAGFLFIARVFAEFLRMYVELSAENFLFS